MLLHRPWLAFLVVLHDLLLEVVEVFRELLLSLKVKVLVDLAVVSEKSQVAAANVIAELVFLVFALENPVVKALLARVRFYVGQVVVFGTGQFLVVLRLH